MSKQLTIENFNELNIIGKVVSTPEFFDGFMSFQLFQESTNLSIKIVALDNTPVKIGQLVNVRGKLVYDKDDNQLVCGANVIFSVQGTPQPFVSKPTSQTLLSKMEEIKKSEKEEDIAIELPITNSETEDAEDNHNTSEENNEKEIEPVDEKEELDTSASSEEDLTEDNEVDEDIQIVVSFSSTEEKSQEEKEEKEEQPVSSDEKEETNKIQEEVISSEENEEKPSNEKKATFRLLKISESPKQPEKEIQKQHSEETKENDIVEKEEENPKNNQQPESRFSLNDFLC